MKFQINTVRQPVYIETCLEFSRDGKAGPSVRNYTPVGPSFQISAFNSESQLKVLNIVFDFQGAGSRF